MGIFYIAEANRKIKALELKVWLNEGILLKSLKKSAWKKTIVLVSYRVSTMNVADLVYEMENGRI